VPENFQRGLARQKSEALDYTRHYAPLSRIHSRVEAVFEFAIAIGEEIGQARQAGRNDLSREDRTFARQLPGNDDGLFGHGQA
jgi:hypothetical protein